MPGKLSFRCMVPSFASKKTELQTALVFIVLSLFLRLPYFFRDVINWDESTFTLLGQSILNGHLPYTSSWDQKPPLLGASFSLFIIIFGKSVASIRLAGALCVALTSWLTCEIGRSLRDDLFGVISGTLTCLSLSLVEKSASATMSEHVALVPLMFGLFILINAPRSSVRVFIAAFFLSAAAMMRTNLAFVVISLGVVTVFLGGEQFENTYQKLAHQYSLFMSYLCGCMFVIGLTFLPYLLTSNSRLWWESVVVSPLGYSLSGYSWSEALTRHVDKLVHLVFDWSIIPLDVPKINTIIVILVFVGAMLGACKLIYDCFFRRTSNGYGFVFLAVAFLSTCVSILRGGQAHFHYLFQIVPFLSLYAAVVYVEIIRLTSWRLGLAVCSLILTISLSNLLKDYGILIKKVFNGQSLNTGTSYVLADYISKNNSQMRPVFFLKYHIGYWFLNQEPITPSSTHPSNLTKDYMLRYSIGEGATSLSAFQEVLDLSPEYIVMPHDMWFLDKDSDSMRLLEQSISQNYKVGKMIDDVVVYRLSQAP